MHYRKLTLSGFGPHNTEKEFTFPNGVVIITGPNGSGKTTVIDAISWAIHGPKAALRSVKDRTSVINAQSQTAIVTLIVDKDNDTMTITRRLTRSGGHTVKVRINNHVFDGGVTASQEVINDFFGAVNASVFSHIATLSSAPSQTVNPFISSDDASRRKFLAELVDPEGDFEKTNKAVRNRLRDDKKELTRFEGQLTGLMDNAPDQPDSQRLTDIEQDIEDHERARRQQEQRMSASRNHDDIQIAGLIATHRSESESLDTRINEINSIINKVNTAIDDTNEELDELDKDIEREEKRLRKSYIRVEEMDAEIAAADTRIDHHKRTIKVLNERRNLDRSRIMAKEQLLTMSEQSEDTCALCGSDITDTSHNHLESLAEEIGTLRELFTENERAIEESESIIEQVKKYRSRLMTRRDKIDPRKISDRIDNYDDRIVRGEDKQVERQHRLKELTRDIDRLTESKSEHDRMVSQLSGDIDPDVLKGQDELNETWTFISDSLADLYAERTKIENDVTAWDHFQEKVTYVENNIHRLTKTIEQHDRLKHQTSPTGVISTMIAEIAESVSVSAHQHLLNTFDRDVDVNIISSVEEGDATCRITVDDRDLSTHSHGEQSRFISAILTALAETASTVTGHWIPVIWDEPTMAADIGITEKFVDMVSGNGTRQSFILTRDDYPKEYVDKVITLDAP